MHSPVISICYTRRCSSAKARLNTRSPPQARHNPKNPKKIIYIIINDDYTHLFLPTSRLCVYYATRSCNNVPFSLGVPMEDLISLPLRVAYQMLENGTGVVARKAACVDDAMVMIAATADGFGGSRSSNGGVSGDQGSLSSVGNTIVAALVDLLHGFEHMAVLVAELCGLMTSDLLAVELMREIGRLETGGEDVARGGGAVAIEMERAKLKDEHYAIEKELTAKLAAATDQIKHLKMERDGLNLRIDELTSFQKDDKKQRQRQRQRQVVRPPVRMRTTTKRQKRAVVVSERDNKDDNEISESEMVNRLRDHQNRLSHFLQNPNLSSTDDIPPDIDANDFLHLPSPPYPTDDDDTTHDNHHHAPTLHPPRKKPTPPTDTLDPSSSHHYLHLSSDHWMSFPFLPDSSRALTLAAWVYLHPSSDIRGSRTILATKASGCHDDAGRTTGGYKLYVNHANTADEELVWEYDVVNSSSSSSKTNGDEGMMMGDGDGCGRVASEGYQISMNRWTHVGVTVERTSKGNEDELASSPAVVRLYLNGDVVAEDTHVIGWQGRQLATNSRSNDTRLPEDVTSLGRSFEMGEILNGMLANVVVVLGMALSEERMGEIYSAGLEGGLNRVRSVEKEVGCGGGGEACLFAFFRCHEGLLHSKKMYNLESLHGRHAILQDFNRRTTPTIFTPLGPNRYPSYKNGTLLTPLRLPLNATTLHTRCDAIRNAMRHAWNGYKSYAWGHDELQPLSKTYNDVWGGMAVTMIDALDTLHLMKLDREFDEATLWIGEHLSFDHVGDVSTFETTIRVLAGLLSAYDWSSSKSSKEIYKSKADDLGRRLLRAFDTTSAFPNGKVNLGSNSPPARSVTQHQLSELGTLQLEFRHLAKLTGRDEYKTKVDHVFASLAKVQPSSGLFPNQINVMKDRVFLSTKGRYTLGATGDSFYEYVLKAWIQGGRREGYLREMYDLAMDGVHEKMVRVSGETGLTYLAELDVGDKVVHKMDHLVCFMAGNLALGAYTDPHGLDSERAQRDLKTGKALAYTCYQMYARTKSGLSPEIVRFAPTEFAEAPDGDGSFYILRPETVESFFILYQLTKDPVYREWGWEIFQAIESHCRSDAAYASIPDVREPGRPQMDRMESFFLAETLKYLYLLQDEDTEIDILNKHVFNTEAHPLRILDLIDD